MLLRLQSYFLMMIAAVAILLSACDSSSTNETPSINSISVDKRELTFHPDDPLPLVTLSINASDSDGDMLSFQWQASGGKFELTGTSTAVLNSSDRTIKWQPDPRGDDYVITVTVSDNHSQATDSVHIQVAPEALGIWRGAVELAGETYERAGFCMFMTAAGSIGEIRYAEVKSGPGNTGFGTARSGGISTSYAYPNLAATIGEPDSDTRDEPLALTGILVPEGTLFHVEIDLESGKKRNISLERTSAGCDGLDSYLRSK